MQVPAGLSRARPRPLAIVAAGAIVWSLVWAWVGLRVAQEVRGLRALSSTVVSVGVAAEETEAALGALSQTPVVGAQLAEPARRIGDAGRSAIASGRASRDSAGDLSVLLGASIAVIPNTPTLMLLILWRRDRRDHGARVAGRPAAAL